ncbi:cell cycle checkpoint control protein RAD9B isoform X1 [Pezoporus flaviventris]|uniref:cell cycle checkpoint control protein RAD9B isoform X1 n=1 Tax=Pezoporus flaviventris TaxID=889875 RepID=UPI002AB32085|nr:cell cycle checkpoint control protein RAD9B isoform X1 [Pezoporus flaviventris]
MKCVIGGAHLRVFGRAIHAIARISDEFWFDPLEKGVPSHLSPSTFNMDKRHIVCNCNYTDCIMEEPFPLCPCCSILCYLSLSRTSGLIPWVKRFLCCTPSEAASKQHVLYQDDSTGSLALRSVNSSRSAYAYVFFSSMFFQHYCWAAVPQPHQKEKQLSPPCKLIIKSVLPVFRCVNMLERNVEKCSIYTDINDHHITFQLLCKHGVVKTYNLTFQECDPLQAVFAKHMCPNVLKLHSRLLADIMVHFPSSQEEVTLSVTPMKVCFKSYTEEDTDFSKTMLTEIQLNPDEFDYFQVGVDSEVTFCLKELRVKDSWCFQKPPVFLSPSILTSLESQLLSALKIWCWKPALSWLPCLTLTRRLPSSNHPALHHGRKARRHVQGKLKKPPWIKTAARRQMLPKSHRGMETPRARSRQNLGVLW